MKLHLIAVIAASAVPVAATANNGLNLIGFGTESVAMGGADTAVARDTTALNTNPAGLGQLTRPAFDVYFAPGYIEAGHADSLGNNRGADNKVIAVGGFGLSRPYAGGRFVGGVGFFAQGGSGAVYKDLQTPFGTRDELSAQVGFVRITPGIAWNAGEQLSIGVAAPLNVMLAKQRIFPGTSVFNPNDPAQSFFGVRLDGARSARLGLRLGMQWRPAANWTFGATFSPKTKLDAKDGEADVNLSATGLGVVKYRDARIEGFALPREIALGVAWQATPRTLLAAKLAHLDWSNALRSLTIALSNPEHPAAPQRVGQTSRVDWRDQTVVAAGLAHSVSDQLTAYAGLNFARNPAPRETLTPLLALIGDRHVTGGLAWRLGDSWAASGAIEVQPRRRAAYNNPAFPLGRNAEERIGYVAANVMLSRRW